MEKKVYFVIYYKIRKSNGQTANLEKIVGNEAEAQKFYNEKVSNEKTISATIYKKVRDFSDNRYPTGKVTAIIISKYEK